MWLCKLYKIFTLFSRRLRFIHFWWAISEVNENIKQRFQIRYIYIYIYMCVCVCLHIWIHYKLAAIFYTRVYSMFEDNIHFCSGTCFSYMWLSLKMAGPCWKMGNIDCKWYSIYSLTIILPYLLTYLLTCLLTPWCRVLLEKLTGLQLVKKFPAFHGTRRFITALTSVHHLSLYWASPILSIYPHPTSWRSILILSTHLGLGLPSGLFPSGFPTKTLYTPSPHPYASHAQPISFFDNK